MSDWYIDNHKLHDLGGTPRFIVATEFPFVQPLGDPSTYVNKDLWTNATYKSNRAAAGNAVHMWGNYFGTTSGASGASNVLNELSNNLLPKRIAYACIP